MQTPAYSHDEVFAAVMALMAAGETPTRANLFNKLGRRGQSLTAWKTYQEMIAAGLLDLPRQVMEEDSSPELAKAEQEVTTGTRANIYADLGTRASNSLMLRNQISRTESYVDSNTVVAAKMDVMATTMKEMRSITEDLLPFG